MVEGARGGVNDATEMPREAEQGQEDMGQKAGGREARQVVTTLRYRSYVETVNYHIMQYYPNVAYFDVKSL